MRRNQSFLTSRLHCRPAGSHFGAADQLGRQGNRHARIALGEVVQAVQAILVIVSPEARSSRHVREALEMASRYHRPVCGVWIEGENWQLPEGHVELASLIDARESDGPMLLGEIATALERVGLIAPRVARLPLSIPWDMYWSVSFTLHRNGPNRRSYVGALLGVALSGNAGAC